MAKHIHAELMAQYAQDAMESETPWDNWEYTYDIEQSKWVSCEKSPSWYTVNAYRRIPKTIVVNGFTVNAPLSKEPVNIDHYFLADPTADDFYYQYSCFGGPFDNLMFQRGLLFNNKEDAIAMAKAMLRIDPNT